MTSDPDDDEIVIFEEDHTNRLGNRIARDYRRSNDKKPQGDCFDACHRRVKKAASHVCGLGLPEISRDTAFGKIWGSMSGAGDGYDRPANHDELVAWFDLPVEYRGRGAPGAMAFIGRGTLVPQSEIWGGKGALRPGAVIQVWKLRTDLDRVVAGLRPEGIGHSFIFLKYVRSGGMITAMKVADQGFFEVGQKVRQAEWGYWMGANVFC